MFQDVGQEGAGAPVAANASEGWPLIDTVQIRNDIAKDSNKGYPSYAALGRPNKIPFLNVRTEAEVGAAMNNFQAKDSLSFGFTLRTIGIAFRAPQGYTERQVPSDTGDPFGICNPFIHTIFETDLPYHAAFRLQIQQDEKMLVNCMFLPPGYGPHGVAAGVAGTQAGYIHVDSITQGIPYLDGRFYFPEKINIPRGASVLGWIEFDDYGHQLLAAMPGPGDLLFCDPVVQPPANVKVPACALIQVSLCGERYVQQRNQLHR